MTQETVKVKIGDEEKAFIVKHPTSRMEAEANMHSSKVFAKLIKKKKDGDETLLLRSQLDDYLRDVGLYTDEEIANITATSAKIKELEEKLTEGGVKKSEGKKIAIDLRKSRYSLIMMLSKRFEYDKNTIEYQTENARLNYLISKCLCGDDGTPVFNSVEDYEFDDTGLKNSLYELIQRIGSICSSYDPDYEAKLIENQFLKKFNFCNDKFELVDAEGHKVNEHGERVDENGNLIDAKVTKKELGEFLDD